MRSVRETLAAALAELKESREGLLEQLATYVHEVAQYNRTHRIVGALSSEEIAEELVVDAMGLVGWISSPLVDVGTGAGLPGLVLKLLRPQLTLTLIEPRQKPAAFLTLMSGKLKLSGLRVLDQRVEEVRVPGLLGGTAAATIVAKGYGPLPRLLESASHLAAPGALVLVPSSEAQCEVPGAEVQPHPLLKGRYIHAKRLDRLDP